MSFVSIASSLYNVGKPIIRDLWVKVVGNLDDLNTRTATLESSAVKIEVFNDTVLNATSASSLTGIAIFEVQSSFTLNNAVVSIGDLTGSFTGTLEIDVKKSSSRGFTGAVSVFTTKPSIDMSSYTDYEESTNAVFDASNQAVSAGDWLRLDITSMPGSNVLGNFHVVVYGESS